MVRRARLTLEVLEGRDVPSTADPYSLVAAPPPPDYTTTYVAPLSTYVAPTDVALGPAPTSPTPTPTPTPTPPPATGPILPPSDPYTPI